MKNFFLLSLTCFLTMSLVGCEDSTPATPQPTAGNEPPQYGTTVKSGRLSKAAGTSGAAAKKELDAKTTLEP